MIEKWKLNRIKIIIELSRALKKYRLKTFFNIFSGILKEICMMLSVGVASYMVAMAIKGDLYEAQRLLMFLGGSVVGLAVFGYIENLIAHDVAFHILVDFRVSMYNAFEKVCPDILLKNKAGQLSVTLMNDVEVLEWFFGHTAGSIVITVVIAIGILGFFGWLHPLLFVAMAISMGIIFAVPFLFQDTADKQGLMNRFKLGEANSVTLEGLNGVKEILTLNYVERYKKKNNEFMNQLTDTQVSYAKRQGIEGGLLQGAVGISAISINLVAISLTLKGALPLEWYTVVGTTVWLAFTPIISLCDKARSFGIIFAAADRVFNILNSKPIVQDTGKDRAVESIEPSIEFDHVSFRYETASKNTIDNVSFHIRPGEMVAFVGESGAGKTTCTNLLMRLWDVSSGSIRIGGHDLRTLSLDTIHTLTSAVLQDVYMFNISIRENIRLSNPSATNEEIVEAAKKAQAHDFIMSFPEGYDTIAGERGTQLSGGQRQRIAIARVLLTKAPILIFDEAVSNLDTKSEMEIQEVLKEISKNRTIILVAHRLSTISSADKLIAFDKGRVVQIGTHDTLSKEDGYYRDLVVTQLC